MDALLDALKKRRGAKIILIDESGSMEEIGESLEDAGEALEDVGEMKEEKRSAKDVLGMEPFSNLKEKDLDMDEEGMMGEDEEAMELEGMDAEVADERIMNRLRNGKEPKGLSERMNYNLMKKKRG